MNPLPVGQKSVRGGAQVDPLPVGQKSGRGGAQVDPEPIGIANAPATVTKQNQEALPQVQPMKKDPLPLAQVEPAKYLRRDMKLHPLLAYLAKHHQEDVQSKGWWDSFTSSITDASCSTFGWFCDEDDSSSSGSSDSSGSSSSSGSTSSSSSNGCEINPKCGDPYASKIVNGAEISIAARPWQIFLYSSQGSMCGGSIISEQYVLTAAHCIHGMSASQLSVYAGHQKSPTSEYIAVTSYVSQIIEHPDYNSGSQDNDIAILKLSTKLTFGSGIQPICMPSSEDPAVGTDCHVSGWGTTSSGGDTSDTLQEVVVPIVSGCGNFPSFQITDHMICAGGSNKDSCQGDSGGPLACKINGVYYQEGVVSFGNGCASEGWPGVYAKVPFYIGNNWIQNNVDKCYTR